MEITINKEDFTNWKNDPITKQIKSVLEDYRQNVEHEMISDRTIRAPDVQRLLERLSGIREGLDIVLNVINTSFDDDVQLAEEEVTK